MHLRETSFSDVCGAVDELKRRLDAQQGSSAGDLDARIEPLLADAEFMMDRMRQRLGEYQGFWKRVRQILSGLDGAVDEVDGRPAEAALGLIRRRLGSPRALGEAEAEGLGATAEDIRAVAIVLENRLRSHKDLALRLFRELVDVKGSRPWLLEQAPGESPAGRMEAEHQAWLPPEPHRRRLLDYLGASRAHVLSHRQADGQPVVQFEDGGAMPMSQIRWDEELKNFRPASWRQGG